MMNIILSKVAGIGALFLLIFLTGYRLNRSGRPYHAILFNFHKLVGLGTLALLVSVTYQANKSVPLSPPVQAAALVAGLFFIATIVTGGLVSLAKPAQAGVALLHNVLPFLTALSSGLVLYMLR